MKSSKRKITGTRTMSEPIKAVTFLCPVFVTGGTEAIHQAAAAMRRNGMPSQIAYIGTGISYARSGQTIYRLDSSPDNPCQTAFSTYEPQAAREIPLITEHLIVAPEIKALDAEVFRPARFAVWWLSVDNAFNHLPLLAEAETSKCLFADAEIFHFYQSEYARRFLIERGVASVHRLTDIVHRFFIDATDEYVSRRPNVLFNRKKGLDVANEFFANSPDLSPCALDGMSMADLKGAYKAHTVYVDFGTLPGKDRMPREAAVGGCVVFVHERGAGREMGDFPLRGFYKFNAEDVASGALAGRIRMVLADPVPHLDEQRHFREMIVAEEEGFADDVRHIVERLRRPVGVSRSVPTAASTSGRRSAAQDFGGWANHADRHCIYVVTPKGYDHHRAFDEAALGLSAAFAERGGSAPVVHHPSEWAGRLPIVLGAHLLSPAMSLALPEGSVIYNLEQIDRASGWLSDAYLAIMRRHRVLDYSHRNIAALRAMGIAHARLLPLGHADALERIARGPAEDIDVLFYGSLNDRRAAVLEDLRARGVKVVHLFNVYGSERDAAIARSKIVLNMHHYEAAIFESARVGYLLANGACVVTEGVEGDPDLASYQGGLAICGYGELADLCMLLLGEDAVRTALGERGRALMRANRQADRLGELFTPEQAAA